VSVCHAPALSKTAAEFEVLFGWKTSGASDRCVMGVPDLPTGRGGEWGGILPALL